MSGKIAHLEDKLKIEKAETARLKLEMELEEERKNNARLEKELEEERAKSGVGWDGSRMVEQTRSEIL